LIFTHWFKEKEVESGNFHPPRMLKMEGIKKKGVKKDLILMMLAFNLFLLFKFDSLRISE
jgi:hypothetical protein